MCGIAGLFSKSLDVSERLGSHLGDMLLQLSDRGPDSAGVAIYRDPAPSSISPSNRRAGTSLAFGFPCMSTNCANRNSMSLSLM